MPKLSEFEEGACFAIEVLKEEVELLQADMRKLQNSSQNADVGALLHSSNNLIVGLKSAFESSLLKKLIDKNKERSCPNPKT